MLPLLFQQSIERAVEHLVDQPGGQRNKNQVGAHLLPFVAVIVRQMAKHAPVQLLGDPRGQWLAPRQILLNARRQRRSRIPVLAAITVDDAEDIPAINARSTAAMARVLLAFVAIALAAPALFAVILHVLRFALAVALAALTTLPLAIAGVGQCRRAADYKREARQRDNQSASFSHVRFLRCGGCFEVWGNVLSLVDFFLLTTRPCVRIPTLSTPDRKIMNRQKKLQQLFKEKAKKANAKLAPKKPKYICKADRLKLEAEAAQAAAENSES